VISAESERLTRIAGDILLANTLDSGRLRLETGRVDLSDLTKDVVDEMRAAFVEREDITISLAPANGGAQVSADPDKLRQVLINLIDNAVKYSPDGGRVEVEIEPRDSGGIRVVVRDEGIGIPGNEQQRIFRKFYRVDPHLSRGVGGTGLGLYICRELVRRMQGRITVDSREGAGSTFCVDLPVAPVAAAERQATVSESA
jgi:two-component system phosphate regulon sensor histidine kinase PhoR